MSPPRISCSELPLVRLGHARQGPAQLFSELVATFGLLAVILGCARLRPAAVAFAVAGYIMAAYWFTASTSFANPAVTLARSMSDTFAGIRPADVPGFIGAQVVGAAAATLLFAWLVPGPGRRAPADARPAIASRGATPRLATAADAPSIAAIYNEGIADRIATFETAPRTPDQIVRLLAERGDRYPTVVVERDGRVVAWAGAGPYRDRAAYAGVAEHGVYVARAARGTGAGREALEALCRACAERGFWKIVSRIYGSDKLAAEANRRRRELLQRNNLDGTLQEIKKLLDEAVLAERKELARALDDDARFQEMRIESLPPSPAKAVQELGDYDWRSQEGARSTNRSRICSAARCSTSVSPG